MKLVSLWIPIHKTTCFFLNKILQFLKIEAVFCNKKGNFCLLLMRQKSHFLPPLYIIRGKKTLLDPRTWPEVSYKIGSVRPSICPQVFAELAHYFFLKLNMVLVAHIKLCMTEPDFFEKSPSSKNDPKWPQNRVFVCNLCKTKILMVH